MAMLAVSLKYDDTSDYDLILFVINVMKRHLPFSTLQILESIDHILHLKSRLCHSHLSYVKKNFVIAKKKK